MLNMVQEIKSIFADHDDFFIQEEQLDQTAFFIIGLSTLIDFTNSNLYIRQMAKMSSSVNELFTNLSDQLDVNVEIIIRAVLQGKLVLLLENNHNVVLDPISHNLNRSIDQPKMKVSFMVLWMPL